MDEERPVFHSETVKVRFHVVEWTLASPCRLRELSMWLLCSASGKGGGGQQLLKRVRILIRKNVSVCFQR